MSIITVETHIPTPVYRAQVAETKIIVKNKWVTPSIFQAIQHGIDKCVCTNRPFNQIVICKLDSPKLISYINYSQHKTVGRNRSQYRLIEDTPATKWIPVTDISDQIDHVVLTELKHTDKPMYDILTSHPPSDQDFLDNSSNNICTGAELHYLVDKLCRYGDHVIVESDKTLLEKPQNYSGIIRTIRIVNEMGGMIMFDIATTLDPNYSYTGAPIPIDTIDKRE